MLYTLDFVFFAITSYAGQYNTQFKTCEIDTDKLRHLLSSGIVGRRAGILIHVFLIAKPLCHPAFLVALQF